MRRVVVAVVATVDVVLAVDAAIDCVATGPEARAGATEGLVADELVLVAARAEDRTIRVLAVRTDVVPDDVAFRVFLDVDRLGAGGLERGVLNHDTGRLIRHAADLVALRRSGTDVDTLAVLVASRHVEPLETTGGHGVAAEGDVLRLVLDPHALAEGIVEVVARDDGVRRAIEPEQVIGAGELEVADDVPRVVDLHAAGARGAGDHRVLVRGRLNGDRGRRGAVRLAVGGARLAVLAGLQVDRRARLVDIECLLQGLDLSARQTGGRIGARGRDEDVGS